MNDAHAAYPPASAFMEKLGQFVLGLQFCQAMQIQFRLALPLATTQASQYLTGYSGSTYAGSSPFSVSSSQRIRIMKRLKDHFTLIAKQA